MGKVIMPSARFLIIVCELGSIETLETCTLPAICCRRPRDLYRSLLWEEFLVCRTEFSVSTITFVKSSGIAPYPRELVSAQPIARYRLAIHCNTGEQMQEMQSQGAYCGEQLKF